MRNRGRSDRRVFSTRRIGIVLLLGLLVALVPMLHPERGQRGLRRGRLPRPSEGRPARRPRRPLAVLQPRVHLVGRLAPQLREPGRVQRLLARGALGQRLELEERRQVPRHPGGQQPDPWRRRVVVRRLRRIVARPRRMGADRRATARSRSRSTTTSTPGCTTPAPSPAPARCGRAASSTSRTPSSATAQGPDRVRHAAGGQEGQDHQRQVECDQPRLPLPVARQRHADLRRHGQVLQAHGGPVRQPCAPRSPRPSRARTPGRRRAPRQGRSPTACSPTPPARRSPGRRRSGCSQREHRHLVAGQGGTSTGGAPSARASPTPATQLHPDGSPAGQADHGQGRLEAPRATRRRR